MGLKSVSNGSRRVAKTAFEVLKDGPRLVREFCQRPKYRHLQTAELLFEASANLCSGANGAVSIKG